MFLPCASNFATEFASIAIVNEGAKVDDRKNVGSKDGDIEVFGKAKLSL